MSSTTSRPSNGNSASAARVPELDGLRGVAILLVVFLHYVSDSQGGVFGSPLYRFKAIFRLGWSGVDLFFVLSGFLIGGILLRARTSSNYFRTFYLRRAHRILPVYYLWVGMYAFAALAFAASVHAPLAVSFGVFRHSAACFLFAQNFFVPVQGTLAWWWLAVAWSLAIEKQFYLTAPPLVRFSRTRTLVSILGATVIGCPVLRWLILRYGAAHGINPWYCYTLMPCRADSLAIGMLAAVVWMTPSVRAMIPTRFLQRALLALAVGLPVLLKWFPGPTSQLTACVRYSWLAMFYAVLLLLVLSSEQGVLAKVMRWKFLVRLGGLSYCIYLIHLAVLGACAALLHSATRIDTPTGVAMTVLAACATWGIARLSWKYVEGPLVRRGHRFSYWPSRSEVGEAELVGVGSGVQVEAVVN